MPDKTGNRKNGERYATRDRINRLLGDIESRFESESGRALVADYIRLLQLEEELEEHPVDCCTG